MHFILVDDHPLFREALRSIIRFARPQTRIEEAESIEAAKAVLADKPKIDLIMLDLSMKGITGFEGLISMRAAFPRIPILVVSGHDEPRIIRQAIELGAAGFVPKSADKSTYIRAMDCIAAGSIFMPEPADAGGVGLHGLSGEAASASARIAKLTPAQLNVLGMLKRGKINKQIAYELGIGDSMVKAHVSEIMRKLGVRNRTQVAICASSLDFDGVGF